MDLNHYIDSDEAFSVLLARQDWSTFITGAIRDRPHPPLHGMLLYLIGQLHLDIAVCGRILGVSASITGFLLLTRMVWQQTACRMLAATVLLVFGFSSFFVYRSLTIRPYSIIIGLGSVQLYFFMAMLTQASGRNTKIMPGDPALRWWLLSSVLLAGAQYLSAPVTAAQCLMLFACLQREAGKRLIAVFSIAVLALLFWYYLGSVDAPGLTETWWVTAPPGGRQLMFTMLTFFGLAPISALWLAALLAMIYSNAMWHWRALEVSDWALAGVALAPVLAIFIISRLGPLNLFAQRQLMVPALAFVILTCTLTRFMPRMPQWSCLFLIIAWAASSLPMGLPRFSKPPFEAMANVFAAHHVQQVLASSWELPGLRYYARSRFVVTGWPAKTATAASFTPGTGFVCRPEKCGAVAHAIRHSSVRMCAQALAWNMMNYQLSGQVLFFLPQALLNPGETCADPSVFDKGAATP